MLYKFIHIDGYEVIIKDISSFIGYVNNNVITERTRVYDEEKHIGMYAADVKEFKEIFDIMKKNDWTVYSIPKAIGESKKTGYSTQIKNLGLNKLENEEENESLIKNFDKKIEKKINIKDDKVSDITKWTSIQVRMSTNARMFFLAAATALILLSCIIIIVSVKMISPEVVLLTSVIKRMVFSFVLTIILTFVISKIFFKNNKFVIYLLFTIIFFAIASILFVDSLEKERMATKSHFQNNYHENYYQEKNLNKK